MAPASEGKAVLIGHDWGAAASYPACAHRPERFEKLVAMAVPHVATMVPRWLVDPDALERSWYVFFFQMLGLPEASVAANDYAIIDWFWTHWSPGRPPDDFMRKLKETLASPGSLEAAIGYYRAMLDPSRHAPELEAIQAGGLGPIPVPTLYLHGAADGVLSHELAPLEDLKQFFPAGLEFELVDGAGHFMLLDRPAEVNARIVRFLTGG